MLIKSATYKYASLDEFSEQYQHQSIKKAQYLMFNQQMFGAELIQILVGKITKKSKFAQE